MKTANFNIGKGHIKLHFDCDNLANTAETRLFLNEDKRSSCIGKIQYRHDPSVSELIKEQFEDNSVYIDKSKNTKHRMHITIKVFNQFVVSVKQTSDEDILILYPDSAHYTYLLDDVFQLALKPFLAKLNGFILHGACLVYGSKAIALLGNSGAGKSTTAFNLVRSGLKSYADDAVVVTQSGDGKLITWPFSKEFSIRPLSAKLLKDQGMSFENYRKEDKKYYFQQDHIDELKGATLDHICLIDVGGEQITTCSALSKDEFMQRLIKENRYFSFINRDQYHDYAKRVTDAVTNVYDLKLGFDLKQLSHLIKNLLVPQDEFVYASNLDKKGRAEKMAIIREAWLNPNKAKIKSIVPLLADSDLLVFKNALGLLQNFPYAQFDLATIADIDVATPQSLSNIEPTLRLSEWIEGCQELIECSTPEMYEQYATGWFTSAPVLFAIMLNLNNKNESSQIILKRAWQSAVKNIKAILKSHREIATIKLSLHQIGNEFDSRQLDLEFRDKIKQASTDNNNAVVVDLNGVLMTSKIWLALKPSIEYASENAIKVYFNCHDYNQLPNDQIMKLIFSNNPWSFLGSMITQ